MIIKNKIKAVSTLGQAPTKMCSLHSHIYRPRRAGYYTLVLFHYMDGTPFGFYFRDYAQLNLKSSCEAPRIRFSPRLGNEKITSHFARSTSLINIGFFVALSLFVFPLALSAQVGIPCDGPDCTFDHLIILANNIIKFLMYSVAVPLAALGFMWIGGNLVVNQDKEGAWSTAKEGFWNIAMGFLIMLGAYLLVKLVIYAFLDTEKGFFTFLVS